MAATILVMDDDKWMRDLLRLHLRNAGYQVVEAEDAVVAGHLLLKQRPDIFLAEIEVPYMTGLELVEAMKSDPATSSVPVIFITCRTDAETDARRIGAAEFLTKPLRVDKLLAAVADHVRVGGATPARRMSRS